jgi:hypothetical protein
MHHNHSDLKTWLLLWWFCWMAIVVVVVVVVVVGWLLLLLLLLLLDMCCAALLLGDGGVGRAQCFGWSVLRRVNCDSLPCLSFVVSVPLSRFLGCVSWFETNATDDSCAVDGAHILERAD